MENKQIKYPIIFLYPIIIGIISTRINEYNLGILPSPINLNLIYNSALFGYLLILPFLVFLILQSIMVKKNTWKKLRYLHYIGKKGTNFKEWSFFFWSFYFGFKRHIFHIAIFLSFLIVREKLIYGEIEKLNIFLNINFCLLLLGIPIDYSLYGPAGWARKRLFKDDYDRISETLSIFNLEVRPIDAILLFVMTLMLINAPSEQRRYFQTFGGFKAIYGTVIYKEHEKMMQLEGSLFQTTDERLVVFGNGKSVVFDRNKIQRISIINNRK